ncbi:MAG: hypothetical protein MZV70_17965 [Desulfobacterales bacterium]|nr:hypothetical protein [Desulfobacterales bacterium]
MHEIGDEETRQRIEYTSEPMGIGLQGSFCRASWHALWRREATSAAIARAIVRAPRLFLFDEPLSNLDAKLACTRPVPRSNASCTSFGIGQPLRHTRPGRVAVAIADQIVVMHARDEPEQVGTYQGIDWQPCQHICRGISGPRPWICIPAVRSLGRLRS